MHAPARNAVRLAVVAVVVIATSLGVRVPQRPARALLLARPGAASCRSPREPSRTLARGDRALAPLPDPRRRRRQLRTRPRRGRSHRRADACQQRLLAEPCRRAGSCCSRRRSRSSAILLGVLGRSGVRRPLVVGAFAGAVALACHQIFDDLDVLHRSRLDLLARHRRRHRRDRGAAALRAAHDRARRRRLMHPIAGARIALVAASFGREATTRADRFAFEFATHLALAGVRIEVLATCARSSDPEAIPNYYRSGFDTSEGFPIQRFRAEDGDRSAYRTRAGRADARRAGRRRRADRRAAALAAAAGAPALGRRALRCVRVHRVDRGDDRSRRADRRRARGHRSAARRRSAGAAGGRPRRRAPRAHAAVHDRSGSGARAGMVRRGVATVQTA